MKQSAMPFPSAMLTTAKPRRAAALWLRVGRVLACFAVVFVLALIVAPGDAQAHGLHGSAGVTAPSAAVDETASLASDAAEVSGTSCLICCTSVGCAGAAIPETFALSKADGPNTGFQITSTLAAYQTADDGLRRPPRHPS